MSPPPTSASDCVQRWNILTGTPEHSTGAQAIVALAHEAGDPPGAPPQWNRYEAGIGGDHRFPLRGADVLALFIPPVLAPRDVYVVTHGQPKRGANPTVGDLRFDQAIGYKQPLFLGGADAVENLELSDRGVYFSLCTQIAQQLRGNQ
ncbi:T6SS immunity protein Tdi1 domain-containing protein [Streptacidiphilus jiangxiensis]|uniref:T6SS immunity protein Tdi1 C-terminal domain-containing protein n=1 Tax=Streptacidiphilus jiangxiensis TaxID=235985 RepID=A0A1H7PAD5_STRJI|nr:T6SS immunity protein Tdi1 domain-containing protein [Streptacidiphilus jiangxiensis]SEL32732.1 protein of unknown function [Streptacidiphilus jiangxiensis]